MIGRIFKKSYWRKRRVYRTLLFLFCLAVLVQLLIVLPLSVDDGGGGSANFSQNETIHEKEETEDADRTEEEEAPPLQLSGDQRMSRIHMLETKEGEKDWELWADQAQSLPDEQRVILNGVEALFHAKKGVTYRVIGDKGMIQVPEKNLEVSGNVQTKTSNGYTFFTNDMKYTSKDRILFTDSPVKVTGPKSDGRKALKLTGKGLRAQLDEARLEVLNEVRAEKILEKGQRAVIRSERARFDGNKEMASFLGEVVLDVDDMRITGPKADFLYDSTGDILKSVVFSGGARVSDPNKWATSREVTVDFLKDEYVFSGNPRVVQNSDELRGEKIIFHNGGKRIEVINARARLDKNRLEEGD